MYRDLGLLPVRVQTWVPPQVQIDLNGHEWLARRLTARGIEHAKIENVFIRISELPRAQHRVKQNWLKMYDKAGLVLRVETVINSPEEFRVRKQVLRYWLAAHQTGGAAQRRGVSVPVSRDNAAGERSQNRPATSMPWP